MPAEESAPAGVNLSAAAAGAGRADRMLWILWTADATQPSRRPDGALASVPAETSWVLDDAPVDTTRVDLDCLSIALL